MGNKSLIKGICFIIAFFTCYLVKAKLSLPTEVEGLPAIFTEESESYRWKTVAKERNFGDANDETLRKKAYWRVYIDREGVSSYISPSLTSEIYEKDLPFFEDYYVAKLSKDKNFALLYKENDSADFPYHSKDVSVIGWVEIDNLLLWTVCPRTRTQITKKVIIVKDLDVEQANNDYKILLYTSPNANNISNNIKDLEFLYVYKEIEGKDILVLNQSNLKDGITDVKKGWLKRGDYLDWNKRICLEPNWGENDTAAIFLGQDKWVEDYGMYGKINSKYAVYKRALPDERLEGTLPRFPIIRMDNGMANVATIGDTSGEKLKNPTGEPSLPTTMKTINIVFVVDGTNSMGPYFKSIESAINAVMRKDKMQNIDPNFGVVVYRNYADEIDGELVDIFPLSKNIDEVSQFLRSVITGSNETNAACEAAFYGIETAVDKMAWKKDQSNFLIWVGDACNCKPDEKGKTEESVVKKITEKHINLIAFQAHQGIGSDYEDWISQAMEIVWKSTYNELSSSKKELDMDRDVTRSDLSTIIKRKEFPYILFSFKGCPRNEPTSTEILKNDIIDNILDYISLIEKNINVLIDPEKYAGRLKREVICNYYESRGRQCPPEYTGMSSIKGYTYAHANDKEIFVRSIFMTKSELSELINTLGKIVSDIPQRSKREHLYNVLKDLAVSYIGDEARDYNEDQIDRVVKEINEFVGIPIFPSFSLSDILDPIRVSYEDLDEYIRSISHCHEKLSSIYQKQSKDDGYFEDLDDNGYFYVLSDELKIR